MRYQNCINPSFWEEADSEYLPQVFGLLKVYHIRIAKKLISDVNKIFSLNKWQLQFIGFHKRIECYQISFYKLIPNFFHFIFYCNLSTFNRFDSYIDEKSQKCKIIIFKYSYKNCNLFCHLRKASVWRKEFFLQFICFAIHKYKLIFCAYIVYIRLTRLKGIYLQ